MVGVIMFVVLRAVLCLQRTDPSDGTEELRSLYS